MIGLLYVLFVILCFLIIGVVLLQKSKSSLGVLGGVGSTARVLFGGTGGQDLFQQITWWMVACLMGGSLILALLKNRQMNESRYLRAAQAQALVQEATDIPQPLPSTPNKPADQHIP